MSLLEAAACAAAAAAWACADAAAELRDEAVWLELELDREAVVLEVDPELLELLVPEPELPYMSCCNWAV